MLLKKVHHPVGFPHSNYSKDNSVNAPKYTTATGDFLSRKGTPILWEPTTVCTPPVARLLTEGIITC